MSASTTSKPPPLPDERYATCANAFLASSDDALQTSRWVINNLGWMVAAQKKQFLQVASFSGSSAFTDVAVALALANTGLFDIVTYVAEHSTAAYLHAVGKAIQLSPETRPLLESGKLRFFAGDTDIARPTDDVSKELKEVNASRFDLLLFHRCLHRLASPTEAVTECVQTLLSSGGTAVVFHTIDDGMQSLREQAAQAATTTDQQSSSVSEQAMTSAASPCRREYLDHAEFVDSVSSSCASTTLNCRVCPLADKLSISVNVRPWADAADGWTKMGTDAMTHVLGVSCFVFFIISFCCPSWLFSSCYSFILLFFFKFVAVVVFVLCGVGVEFIFFYIIFFFPFLDPDFNFFFFFFLLFQPQKQTCILYRLTLVVKTSSHGNFVHICFQSFINGVQLLQHRQ